MKKLLFMTAFPLLISLMSFASGVGNGGFVTKCDSRVIPLDYYEAEQAGRVIDLPKPIYDQHQTFLTQRVYAILNRLKKLDPNRAAYYQAAYYRYFSDTYADYPAKYLDINGLTLSSEQAADPTLQLKFGLGPVQIPAGCELILAAQQEIPTINHGNNLRLKIQLITTVWKQLDVDTQAGIVVHELFYHEFLLRNVRPQNSVSVRHLVGLLVSSDFEKLTRQQWNQELRENNFSPIFPEFEYAAGAFCQNGYGLCFYFGHPNPYNDSTIPYSNEDFGIPYRKIGAAGSINICDKKIKVVSNTGYFIFGEIPAQSVVADPQNVDLSCHTTNDNIELQVAKSCAILMEKQNEPKPQALLKEIGKNCESYLKGYSNPLLKVVGQPKAFAFYNQNTKSLNLTLKVVPFSDVHVYKDNVWMRLHESSTFDLKTGQILEIDGK